MFRSDGTGSRGHMLAVYIDERLGWIAKHVALLRPDALDQMTEDGPKLHRADLATTCRNVAQAIKRTDAAANPPVNKSFSRYRAIALARFTPLAH